MADAPSGCKGAINANHHWLTPHMACDVATRAITTHHPPSATANKHHSKQITAPTRNNMQHATETAQLHEHNTTVHNTSTTHRAAGGQTKTGVYVTKRARCRCSGSRTPRSWPPRRRSPGSGRSTRRGTRVAMGHQARSKWPGATNLGCDFGGGTFRRKP